MRVSESDMQIIMALEPMYAWRKREALVQLSMNVLKSTEDDNEPGE